VLLELVLQRLYDSEINVTITWLWDGKIDFSLHSYMDWPLIGTPLGDFERIASVHPYPNSRAPIADAWHSVNNSSELAKAIHEAALKNYPDSDYARLYGRIN
jgi:hypothetical protein